MLKQAPFVTVNTRSLWTRAQRSNSKKKAEIDREKREGVALILSIQWGSRSSLTLNNNVGATIYFVIYPNLISVRDKGPRLKKKCFRFQ